MTAQDEVADLLAAGDPGSTVRVGDGLELSPGLDLTVASGSTLDVGEGCVIRRDVEIRVTGGATVRLGRSVKLDRGVRIIATNGSTVAIGEGTAIGLGSVLNGGDDLMIGRQCLVSGYVYLQTSMHRFAAGTPIREQGYDHAPVVLGDDVWLGTHVTILPGCNLADGTVVGSNAVLRTSTQKEEIWAGVPARCVGQRG